MRTPIDDRFLAKVDTTAGPDACHPWLAHTSSDGYGIFWDGTYDDKGQGRKVRATRWAFWKSDLATPAAVSHSRPSPMSTA